jgi:hypothetical protein
MIRLSKIVRQRRTALLMVFLPHLNLGGTQVGDRRVAHSLYVYTPPELSLHHLVLNVQAELADAGLRSL